MWIEVHEGLIDHPKTWRVAEALGIKPVQVVGHLVTLWLWALDSAPDGILDVPAIAIARGAHWQKEPGKFVEALLSAGFIDRAENESFLIHNWEIYAGRLIDQRSLTREQRAAGGRNRMAKLSAEEKTLLGKQAINTRWDTSKDTSSPGIKYQLPNRTIPNHISISTNIEEEETVQCQPPPPPLPKTGKDSKSRTTRAADVTPEFLAKMVQEFQGVNVYRLYRLKFSPWCKQHHQRETELRFVRWLEREAEDMKVRKDNGRQPPAGKGQRHIGKGPPLGAGIEWYANEEEHGFPDDE